MTRRCAGCGAPIAGSGNECAYCGSTDALASDGPAGQAETVFEQELKRESRQRYRQSVVRALDDDGVIDPQERALLEDVRAVSGLSEVEAREVEAEVVGERGRAAEIGWGPVWADPFAAYTHPAPGYAGYSPYSGTGWYAEQYATPPEAEPPPPPRQAPYCPHCQNRISEANILHQCRLCARKFCDRCPGEFTLPIKFKSYRVGWSEERNLLLADRDDQGREWEVPRQVLKHHWVDLEPRLCDRCYEKELPLALRALKSGARRELMAADEETLRLKRAGARESSRVSRIVPDNLFLHQANGMIVAALEGCPSCRGGGWCGACEGSGECRKCKGTATCPVCRGPQTGNPDPGCQECLGSGSCPMPRCQEGVCGYCTGQRSCSSCQGTGEAYTDWAGELASRLRQVFEEIAAATCLRCHGRLEAATDRDQWYCPGCQSYV